MSGLTLADLAPATLPATVRGKSVQVRGVSLGFIAGLLLRFPQVASLASGAVNAAQLSGLGREAVGAILAAAIGHADDADWEAALADLPAEDQMAVLEPVITLTMPTGLAPFVEKLVTLISSADASNVKKSAGTRAASPKR